MENILFENNVTEKTAGCLFLRLMLLARVGNNETDFMTGSILLGSSMAVIYYCMNITQYCNVAQRHIGKANIAWHCAAFEHN